MGERVRVAYAPLGMVEGLIEPVPDVKLEDIDAHTRLKLTIDIFGRPTPVELAAWQVEKL